MNLISCQGCGVVIDFDSYALEKEERTNHDQDKICEHAKCPVCKAWIPSEDWRNFP